MGFFFRLSPPSCMYRGRAARRMPVMRRRLKQVVHFGALGVDFLSLMRLVLSLLLGPSRKEMDCFMTRIGWSSERCW